MSCQDYLSTYFNNSVNLTIFRFNFTTHERHCFTNFEKNSKTGNHGSK